MSEMSPCGEISTPSLEMRNLADGGTSRPGEIPDRGVRNQYSSHKTCLLKVVCTHGLFMQFHRGCDLTSFPAMDAE